MSIIIGLQYNSTFARRDDKNILNLADFHKNNFPPSHLCRIDAELEEMHRCKKLRGEIVNAKGATRHCVSEYVLSVSLLLSTPGGQTILT